MKKEGKVTSGLYKDIFASTFLFLLGILMIITSFSFKQLTSVPIGPRFFPQLIGITLIVINIFYIFNKLKTLKYIHEGKVDVVEQKVSNVEKKLNKYSLFSTIILVVVSVLLLDYFGFIVTSCVYLFFQFLVLAPKEKRNYILFAIIAIVSTFVVNYLFVNGFDLILPRGRIW